MACEVSDKRRGLLVFLLLCLMFYGQSAALVSAIEPHHATGHCCLLCHVGSLPCLEIATPVTVAPIVVVARVIANPDIQASHEVLVNTNASRAPPV